MKRRNEAGSRLRKIRDSLGLTQAQMAGKLAVGLRTYHGWEHGRSRIPADALLKAMRLEDRKGAA